MRVPLAGAQAAAVLLTAFAFAFGPDARADDGSAVATFALIMGSNVSMDADLPPLKYADDDAATYLDLFRVLGARTYLLSRLDDNTRRLHAQAAAEALEPKRVAFEQAVAQITADVTRARDRQVETVLYIVYAGHGNVRNGEGYVTLEDMRITGADLAQAHRRSLPRLSTRGHRLHGLAGGTRPSLPVRLSMDVLRELACLRPRREHVPDARLRRWGL